MVDVDKGRPRGADDFLKRHGDQSTEKESPTPNNCPPRLVDYAVIEVEGDGDYAKAIESERDRQIWPRAEAEVLSLERTDLDADERVDEPGNVPRGEESGTATAPSPIKAEKTAPAMPALTTGRAIGSISDFATQGNWRGIVDNFRTLDTRVSHPAGWQNADGRVHASPRPHHLTL